MDYFDITIIIIAVAGSAVIKNGVGIGAGIFMLPFLAIVLPPKLALGLGAPAMLVSDIVGVKNYWGSWDRKEVMLLLLPAVIGVVLGGLLVKAVPDDIFKSWVGAIALTFSSYQLGKIAWSHFSSADPVQRIKSRSSHFQNSMTALFGFLGGGASTVAHAGGMVLSIHLLDKQPDSRRFVGTFVLFFCFTNLLKLITYLQIGIISVDSILMVAAMTPAIILGGVAGNILNRRIPQNVFRVIVLILIFLIGTRLLLAA